MLLFSLTKKTDSLVVTTAIIRENKEDNWTLAPSGKQIVRSNNTDHYILNRHENEVVIASLNQDKFRSLRIGKKILKNDQFLKRRYKI